MRLIKFHKMVGGLHWVYENNKGETLSIICHGDSYGWKSGKFETQCNWLKDVKGFLSFEQVARKIKTLERREK